MSCKQVHPDIIHALKRVVLRAITDLQECEKQLDAMCVPELSQDKILTDSVILWQDGEQLTRQSIGSQNDASKQERQPDVQAKIESTNLTIALPELKASDLSEEQLLHQRIAPQIAFWKAELREVAKARDVNRRKVSLRILETIPMRLRFGWKINTFQVRSFRTSHFAPLIWHEPRYVLQTVDDDLHKAFSFVLEYNEKANECFLEAHTSVNIPIAKWTLLEPWVGGEWHKVRVELEATKTRCEAYCAFRVSELEADRGYLCATFVFHPPSSPLPEFYRGATQHRFVRINDIVHASE